jgi:CDP-4-dehydro-6-deoxyglucose reductase
MPTFSREEPGEHCTGYVHAVYEGLCKSKMTPSPDNPEVPVIRPAYFYLCGWKDMIDEAKQRIQAMGYEKKAIHQELYG